MNLKAIFHKPVDRPIEGVIKADDEASLRVEIEEYILTNEVEKRLQSFLSAYNDHEGASGVWISGFFGSGKSHLLKMLALLLENRQIDGASTLDLFLPKCGDNQFLKADLRRASDIPSKSILFNIDQKADVISKTEIDALLAVFVKVFDQMCGYYGKQGHIAQFERDLDSRGLYEQFKSTYESITDRTWEKGREQSLLEAENIAKAYAQATGADEASTIGVLDKYRDEYRISIEDFAEQVHAYMERQSPDFRLNFLVDEVGQYIAGNVKLMTNLQTIAESLATKCRGRAWIIVTAQEDMDMVVGEMGKQQANDFSKIQDRFSNRMKLTSADVAEVIQKRLLTKNEEGSSVLCDIYRAQSNNFKTLFDFADGSKSYRNFQDQDHFIRSYPFIPYQFALFQSAILNLSKHNAFEGKHRSVGERSMLGVFQQVAIGIGDREIGRLATFDLMFEGIRSALKSNIQQAILQAEKHLDDVFAIQVLKALFLVKYVKEFKSTGRNLYVLMLGDFNQNIPGLRNRVEEALNLLEQQTYIQRNGEFYEYLTDEEKDIELEIKHTEVPSAEVATELEKIIFEDIVRQRKIRYDENGHDYPFTRKLDDRQFGREHELTLHIITSFHDQFEDEKMLRANSSYNAEELFMVLPADERLVREMLMFMRTEKYIRQNISVTQQEVVRRILLDKSSQNQGRRTELKTLIQTLMGKAKLLVAGNDVETGAADAQGRMQGGFQKLIARTYPNLLMLRGILYTENDIAKHLQHSRDGLAGTDATALAESEQELFAFIQNNRQKGLRTTLKNLLENFERKPYGWYYAAVLCILASLYARGKVEVRSDGNLLEEGEMERVLCNTRDHGNVILESQVEFTASQVRSLKDFFQDFFNTPPPASDAKTLGKEVGREFKTLLDQLALLVDPQSQYPFQNVLDPVLKKLESLVGKTYAWYLTELTQQKDELLDMRERVIAPILGFMGGSQKDIFDTARRLVQVQEANFSYIEGDEGAQLQTCLTDQDCFKGARMQQMRTLVESLSRKIEDKVKNEIVRAKQMMAALQDRLGSMDEFGELSDEQQAQIVSRFSETVSHIENCKLIAVIRDTLRRFEEFDYPQLLSQITSWTQPKPTDEPDGTTPQDGMKDGKREPRTGRELHIEYVTIRAVNTQFDKAWLADGTDVEHYLESLRTALLAEIHKGKRIQI